MDTVRNVGVNIWWLYAGLAISIFFCAIFIAFAVYFSRAMNFANDNPGVNPPISSGTANIMMWFSIIFCIAAAVMATALIVRLVVYRHDSIWYKVLKDKKEKTNRKEKSELGEDCSSLDDYSEREECRLRRKIINRGDCTNPGLTGEARRICNLKSSADSWSSD